ncbi:enoyl-CoA hydratase [Actinomycetospora endophytica]|uniref:Enoyl-CoA hydratase n=1 Tax=Actinomycetospora endophytica TaxID=2291215 RepID=A0ABS8PAM5_9PSEU|nr:MaoC/PaaZ C-terminal domain-containing protein [Actinomycetospora endophytica]MCD2195315.1 enoyl-CoA hydratase [Actinomycetospora endophytica]
MALRPDLLGARAEPVEFFWGPDDVMLYALAVGAGQADPLADLEFTTENLEGSDGPRVLPGFANIVTRGARVDAGGDDPRVLHAEQAFRVHAALPSSGRARVTGSVVGVEDKRSGVLVRTRAEAVDAGTGALLAETLQTVMIRGETAGSSRTRGTLGSQERPDPPLAPAVVTPPGPIPEREPDRRVVMPVRSDQALLFRLTGDRNPLHTDPAFARRAGFERPILHGMCTYGFAARTLGTIAGDPGKLVAMHARFTRPVLPGDELEVAVWDGEGGTHFRTTRDDEPVLDQGWAEFG